MICKSSLRRMPLSGILLVLILLAVSVLSAHDFSEKFAKGTQDHHTLQTEEEKISLETAKERFHQSMAEAYKYA